LCRRIAHHHGEQVQTNLLESHRFGTVRDSKEKLEYELSDEDREWVARIVDSLGPLTQEDREFLGLILRKHR